MNVLIPLNVYYVDHELGFGQPFSKLDRLVLEAIAERGGASLLVLEELFRIPRRLLIESMAGLARAGWVGMTATKPQLFALTPPGERALTAGDLPSALQIREETCSVIMERVAGKLLASSEVTFRTRQALVDDGTWETARRVPPGDVDSEIDEGQVEKLVPKRPGEWVRWISKPKLGLQPWLVVSVDEDARRISELPEQLRHLSEHILGPVASPPRNATFEGLADLRKLVVPSSRPELVSLSELPESDINVQDTLMTNAAHAGELENALRVSNRAVLITSAFLDSAAIRGGLGSWIEGALGRGCNVDLLWGYAAPAEALEMLKALSRSSSGKGKLRFNTDSSGSHAKLLVYDTEDGSFRAVVGSYNWLSVDPNLAKVDGQLLKNVSVRTSNAITVAEVCRSVSALWSATGGVHALSDVPDRWGGLASELARAAAVVNPAPSTVATMKVIRDREHEHILRDLILSSTVRCAVMSHRLGAKCRTRLASFDAVREIEQDPIIIYGERETESEFVRQASAAIQGTRVRFRHCLDFHSKLVLSGNFVLASSYNFLSADPFGASRRSKEVGVLVRSSVLADRLWEALAPLGA